VKVTTSRKNGTMTVTFGAQEGEALGRVLFLHHRPEVKRFGRLLLDAGAAVLGKPLVEVLGGEEAVPPRDGSW